MGAVSRPSAPARPVARRRARRSYPVWIYRRLTAPLRPLPAFLVIGAQKCGTTSTYAYLARHPSIDRAWRKEVRFFDVPTNYALGEIWYRAHFALRRSGRITGEATPGYMFYADAPARMARHVPGARLIALVRNPVDRAISHYHFLARRGRESRPIDAALDRQLLGAPSAPADDADTYLARGLYAEQLERVLRVFPREQLLVVRSEELLARPGPALARMFDFLGLPAWDVDVSRRLNAGAYGTIPPPVRRRLVAFFRPHNERLYDLLGQDLGWDR
jgi:hypothetical protein